MSKCASLSPPWYYFTTGLLYPGAMGAALTWFVHNVTAYATHRPSHQEIWMLAFALWFAVYHGFLFLRLRSKYNVVFSNATHPTVSPPYHCFSLSSDILDSMALFVAFGAIGSQSVAPTRFGWLFVAAALVPISALVARTKADLKKYPGLCVVIGFALVAAAIGALFNFCGAARVWAWNWSLLLGLWGLLFVYLKKRDWRAA
jgi:hypothetical protein